MGLLSNHSILACRFASFFGVRCRRSMRTRTSVSISSSVACSKSEPGGWRVAVAIDFALGRRRDGDDDVGHRGDARLRVRGDRRQAGARLFGGRGDVVHEARLPCAGIDQAQVAARDGRRGGLADEMRVHPEVHEAHGERPADVPGAPLAVDEDLPRAQKRPREFVHAPHVHFVQGGLQLGDDALESASEESGQEENLPRKSLESRRSSEPNPITRREAASRKGTLRRFVPSTSGVELCTPSSRVVECDGLDAALPCGRHCGRNEGGQTNH